MIIKWIYQESEEILGIKRNKGDILEFNDIICQQLISQGKAILQAQDKQKNEVLDKKPKGVK